jgi:bifunctional DNA-binding transcriptional regulator/antitoxin component of YhaV-PrlF toxin-antitoxin module
VTDLVGAFGAGDTFIAPKEVLETLGLKPGDAALVWVRSDQK